MHHVTAGRFARASPNGLSAHGDGFGALAGFGRKAFNHHHFNVLFGKALNVLHEAFFVQAHQVDRSAVCARTPGAANAVHIVFAHIGDFVVHHVRQVVNVDAARGNVGRHQGAHVTALETGQRLGACCLAFVAVQRHGRNAVLFQKLGHVVGAKLGAGEHQHLAPVVGVDDVRQQRLLFAPAHRVDDLGDALHRGVARRDLHALRVFEQRGSQFADFIAEGGRKQKALLVARHQGQHFFHVVDEAHVEHAVGLVEHQDLHLAQVQHALLLQVKQTSGGGYQQVHAFFELGDLRVHAHTAKNDGAGQVQVFAVSAYAFFHLGREFAGGREHQGADANAAKFVFGRGRGGEALQHGQGKRCGFAGAGLRAAQQVVAGQHQGYGLRLNGGRGFVTLFQHGFKDGRRQIQFVEVHKEASLERMRTYRPIPWRFPNGQSKAGRFKNGTNRFGICPQHGAVLAGN